jgi:hypothetical protein
VPWIILGFVVFVLPFPVALMIWLAALAVRGVVHLLVP